MTDTTQAIRDALLADVVATATAGIYAAVLAERERCATLCEALTVRKRWAAMAGNGQKTIEPCAIATAIREGVKS